VNRCLIQVDKFRYAWLSLTRDGKRVVRVYLSDNRTELPRTHEHVDAPNSRRFGIRQPSLRGPVVLRDEEAVGSNPATPTILSDISGHFGRIFGRGR
jgi:hypothetical protein